ncbi:MAG: serine protease [Candidatus Schekmanbacteria bacterium]|nr:serine protease [Candidatus Schekmanbacteria bacterium]
MKSHRLRVLLGSVVFFTGVAVSQAAAGQEHAFIVGGVEAAPGAWPWQVALIRPSLVAAGYSLYDAQFCGGSLIAREWVATAAHCVLDDNGIADPATIGAVVGAHNLETPEPGYQQLGVAAAYPHALYNGASGDNDIALLRLARPADVSGGVQTVPPLGDAAGSLEGVVATVTGWGATSEAGAGSVVLLQVEIPIISNAQCESWLDDSQGQQSWVTDNMVCAGFMNGEKDSCQGDSGGPLVVPSAGTGWSLAGIVSWGMGCARAQSPGVYTRVSRYAAWVEQIMKPPRDDSSDEDDGPFACFAASPGTKRHDADSRAVLDLVWLLVLAFATRGAATRRRLRPRARV